jgi:N-acetylmuramoyl-L-alanine amidase
MAKKYILAGALSAFLLTPKLAEAPVNWYNLPKERTIKSKSLLELYLGDSVKKFEEIKKASEQRLEEERIKRIEEERKQEELRNYRTRDFYLDSEEMLFARMIFGEGEDCTQLEKIKIAWTALNRKNLGYGKTLKDVILAKNQYSCFNPEMDSSKFLKYPLEHNEGEFLASLQVAREVLAGKYKDPTGGATHYYNPFLIGKPNWAKTMKKLPSSRGDRHVFYKN